MVRLKPGKEFGEPVFLRGSRWQSRDAPATFSSGSFTIRGSSGRQSASHLRPAEVWGGVRETVASETEPQQSLSPFSTQEDSRLPVFSNEAYGEGAGPSSADALPAGSAAVAAVSGVSFLEVLSSADACASSQGSTGSRVRTLLGWAALGILALKLLLRPDKALRPRVVLVLDFIKTVTAWQLLQLWPPYELPAPTEPTQNVQQGAVGDSCDVYAAAQLIEAILWLFILKLLLRHAEVLLGFQQGEYLRMSSCSACRASSRKGAAATEIENMERVCIVGCKGHNDSYSSFSKGLWKIDWGRYLQQLGILLICVAAAQLITLCLLMLFAAPLAPIVSVPLWLLHRDSASARRFIVAFACPMCTDLLQFCSLDALIRRRPSSKDSLHSLSDPEERE